MPSLDRRIITPAEAIARATIRPRSAPPARPHATLGGWVHWGLIDRQGREVQGGDQDNLVLDGFLDWISENLFSGLTWSNFLAVGTGSSEPDVTDTALDSELARTSTLITNTRTRPANGVYEFVREREFDFAEANGNLTEWGWADGSSSDMLVRELFRDELGDPVTVTKTSDFKLRVKYTFTLTLTPTDFPAGSFVMDGIGTLNGTYGWIGATQNVAADLGLFSIIAQGSGLGGIGASSATSWVYTSNRTLSGGDLGSSTPAGDYTAGTHTRDGFGVTFSTSQGNLDPVAAFVARQGGASTIQRVGYVFLVDSADRFTKDDLHIMSVEHLTTVSWGRAT